MFTKRYMRMHFNATKFTVHHRRRQSWPRFALRLLANKNNISLKIKQLSPVAWPWIDKAVGTHPMTGMQWSWDQKCSETACGVFDRVHVDQVEVLWVEPRTNGDGDAWLGCDASEQRTTSPASPKVAVANAAAATNTPSAMFSDSGSTR